ncbi:MAG: ROK family protein [Actinomycetota bacterium]
MHHILAIDIGGTKLAVAIVDEKGRIRDRKQIPTHTGTDDSLYERVLDLSTQCLATSSIEPTAIGIGCGGPGRQSYELVSPLNISNWRDFPLRKKIENDLSLPTFIDNDAKALALAEGWLGAAQGCSNYIAMVVSTGIGGGIVLNGKLLEGTDGNAGHIGHIFVEPGGGLDANGVSGLLEGSASGSGLERKYGFAPSEASDEIRIQTGTYVGRAVASIANLLDLQLAVVAGSVAFGFGDIFFEAAQNTINDLTKIQHSQQTEIVPGGLGDQGPLTGAAAVALQGLGKEILSKTDEI